MAKKRILLVDDEAGFTRLVKFNLERTGKYEVKEVNHSVQAVKAAQIFDPDLILLDVVMPGMDGGDVVAELRKRPELEKIPVIMLTALVAKGELSRNAVAESGDLVMIGKPVDIVTLTHCIDEALYFHEDELEGSEISKDSGAGI